jgi:carbonic anhydrase/acetyltransferase-like protein (isoleucine patch superfamily)
MNLAKNVLIHPSAVLIGLVEIGEYSSIWPNVVVRADTNTISIGQGVNIQDNSTLHVDSKHGIIIGDYSLIGHNTVLHSCNIGKGCLIGIGSIVLENTIVGDGSMITAGCIIRGSSKIPPNSLVINKKGELIIRENKSKPLTTIMGSLEYIELAKRFKNEIWGPIPPEEIEKIKNNAKNIFKKLFYTT